MKINLPLKILFLVVLGSAYAYAGAEGHGGETVVCPSRPPEVYDSYEARVRGILPSLGSPQMKWSEKVDFALDRLGRQDHLRASIYKVWAHNFLNDSKIDDFNLTKILDDKRIIAPQGCEVVQVVVQREPKFKEDKRYYVSESIWAAMDETQKAILVLHEVIFREALTLGAEDSIGTRYLNSYIFSDKFDHITNEQYYDLLRNVDFLFHDGSFITIFGLPFAIDGTAIQIHDDKTFGGEKKIFAGFLAKDTNLTFQGREVLATGAAGYYISGQLFYFMFYEKELPVKIGGATLPLTYGLNLYPSGNFMMGFLARRLKISVQGQVVNAGLDLTSSMCRFGFVTGACMNPVNQIEYYENGNLKSVAISGQYKFRTVGSSIKTVGSLNKAVLTALEFNEMGELIADQVTKP